jgi:two-component system OmpR family sensor kinase
MNMKRRLTVRFIIQMIVAAIIALIIATVCLIWAFQKINEISINKDFASVGLEQLIESSKLTPEGIRFDAGLLEQVKLSNGWLQSLDEDGRVEHSYLVPNDVPNRYAPGELVDYWTKRKPFPYDLYLWIQEKNGKTYTLVYGLHRNIEKILEQSVSQASLSLNGTLIIPQAVSLQLEALGGFIQLLDSEGTELASYNKPDSIETQYSVSELALRSMYEERYGYKMNSSYDPTTGRTWVIMLPTGSAQEQGNFLTAEGRVLLIGGSSMIVALVAILLLLSLWNAHRFGGPMLHMLTWLDGLGRADYREPMDRRGIARSKTISGKWRPRYRVFTDVMHSIDNLSRSLLREQELRNQNKSLREEWISGITHDLKTPLSSIKGYAHMLAEPGYTWGIDEVQKFSTIMLEKSAHMDVLINDLALTYRIKAGVKPDDGELLELNSWLSSVLNQASNHPTFVKEHIQFKPAPVDIVIKLYGPWLERVVLNISANALVHNPPNTKLIVSVWCNEANNQVVIQFVDDGQGMDEKTADRLFERYFRGTGTNVMTAGSGLGMAIAKDLVEAMHGTIEVDTSVGSGTTIRLIWSNPELERRSEE